MKLTSVVHVVQSCLILCLCDTSRFSRDRVKCQFYSTFLLSRNLKDDDQLGSSSVTLPDPHCPLSDKLPTEAIASVNVAVTKVLMKSEMS